MKRRALVDVQVLRDLAQLFRLLCPVCDGLRAAAGGRCAICGCVLGTDLAGEDSRTGAGGPGREAAGRRVKGDR